MRYQDLNKEELLNELKKQREKYNYYQSKKLSLDMTRGRPSADQLDLSNEMLGLEYVGDFMSENNMDTRNYGLLEGIPEARRIMGQIIDTDPSKVVVCGNSSLAIMYDIIAKYMLFGVDKNTKPWGKYDKIRFLCPVPGYDRHFTICESLGIEMINVAMDENGPDMDEVERLLKEDDSIKGIWCIPRYSNPTGCVYSDEVIRRLASVEAKADDFRVFFDDAYALHFFENGPVKILNIIDECEKAGYPNRPIVFSSTSKITYAGSGLAAIASSIDNIKEYVKSLSSQTIGFDKLNQLRHANFLKDFDNIVDHMHKHAKILKPKFDIVLETFQKELGDLDILEWTKPSGGYFISIDTIDNLASKVVALTKDVGVLVTPAGSTFPYKKDPRNRNIRIAPSCPSVEDLSVAVNVLTICIKIASLEYFYKEKNYG